MRFQSLLVAVLVWGIASSASAAQTDARSSEPTSTQTSTMGERDREFVQMVMDSNARELQLSMRAKEKAQSDAVRQFAATMIEEHGKKGKELAQFSRRMTAGGGPPLKRQDRSVRATVKELDQLEGASFDRGYMKVMVDDHKKAIRLYEREVKAARDPQLKELAQTTLPDLRRHLQMAMTIVAEME